MKLTLNKKQLDYISDLARKRHDAKSGSFRNSSMNISGEKNNSFEETLRIDKQYATHFIGLVGEYAWSLYSGEAVDEEIYAVRDGGEDFKGIEVKTITYMGNGEPELKITQREYEDRKKPKKYVLVRFDIKNKEVEILGTITRYMFDKEKKEKKYGRFLPKNFVVPVSKMRKLK